MVRRLGVFRQPTDIRAFALGGSQRRVEVVADRTSVRRRPSPERLGERIVRPRRARAEQFAACAEAGGALVAGSVRRGFGGSGVPCGTRGPDAEARRGVVVGAGIVFCSFGRRPGRRQSLSVAGDALAGSLGGCGSETGPLTKDLFITGTDTD